MKTAWNGRRIQFQTPNPWARPPSGTSWSAMWRFAGKMATRRRMMPHAATRRVAGTSTATPSTISARPDR